MYTLILHGRRLVQLQKWRSLRVFVQNASSLSSSFSSASIVADVNPRDGRNGKSFTVSYLVDSLGLTRKLAESISKKVSFEDQRNPDSVLNLLRNHGFTESQISTIITDYPRLLILDGQKSLGPKLQFLQSRVVSSSEFTEIVSKVPKILARKGEKSISVYYDFVKEIIKADKSSMYKKKLSLSLPEGNVKNKIRNVSVLRELGVPQRLLFSLLTSDSQPVGGKEKFDASLKKVVEMGFDPTTPKFVEALRVVYGLSHKRLEETFNVYKRFGITVNDTWKLFKKCPTFLGYSEKRIIQTFETLKSCGLLEDEVLSVFKKNPQYLRASEQKILNSIETFRSVGFSRDEFMMMVKHYPTCITCSAEKMTKKAEFLVKKMNWPLKGILLRPQVLGYSMEKRIVPRCNVIKALMSKGLLGSEIPPMSSVLACTDQVFLNRYVVKHDDKLVLELKAIFTGGRVS